MKYESENNAPAAKPELRMTREIPFVVGQEVVMKRKGRNGKPDWFQPGWKVESSNEETGEYIVTFDDVENNEFLEKSLSPAELTSYQPDAMVDKPGTTELSYESSEFAPKPVFAVGDVVTVNRYTRDAEGKRIPGQEVLEPGWKVIDQDQEAGVVVVESPDQQFEKTYSIEMLEKIQAEAAAPELPPLIDKVPDFVEAARSIVDSSGELHERASEDLGEVATDEVVEKPAPEASIELSPAERMSALTEGLSDDDLTYMRSYADASVLLAKMGQNDKGSNYLLRAQSSAKENMSPSAKAVLSQYVALYSN